MHVHRLAPLALAFSSLACADFTTDDATYSAELVSGGVEVMRIDEKNDTCVHMVISTIGDPANIPEGRAALLGSPATTGSQRRGHSCWTTVQH